MDQLHDEASCSGHTYVLVRDCLTHVGWLRSMMQSARLRQVSRDLVRLYRRTDIDSLLSGDPSNSISDEPIELTTFVQADLKTVLTSSGVPPRKNVSKHHA